MSEKARSLLIVSAVITILSAAIIVVLSTFHNRSIQHIISIEHHKFVSAIHDLKEFSFTPYRKRIVSFLALNDSIVEAFAKRDRESVYELTLPIYNALKNENEHFHVLHFHLPDGHTFLRMHNPEFSGDDLTSVRPIIHSLNSMKNKKQHVGYGIGKHGPYYRIAQPVFVNDEYIGAIEFGIAAHQAVAVLQKRLNIKVASIFKKDRWQKATLAHHKETYSFGDYVMISHGEKKYEQLSLAKSFDFESDGEVIELEDKSFLLHAHPIFNNSLDETIGGVLVLQDISAAIERKKDFINKSFLIVSLMLVATFFVLNFYLGRVINKLINAEKMMQLILDTIPTRVFWKDKNSSYLGCNKQFAQDAGVDSPKDVIGKNDYDLAWIDQADLYRSDDQFVIETGQAKLNYEEPQTGADGEPIWLMTSKVPLTNLKDQAIGVLGTYSDITPLKNNEKKLHFMKEQWEQRFDAIDGFFSIQDTNMRVTHVNTATAKLLNRSKEELIGKYCYELFAGAASPCSGCPIPYSTQNFMPYANEIFHQTLHKHLWVTASPIVVDDDKIDSIVHFATDLTEMKKLEEQFRQAQKMESIGRLAAGIAHDFNNLLTTILGFSELLLFQLPKEEEMREYIESIHDSGKQAASLTRQLLAFSRKQILELRTLNINHIVDLASKLLTRLLHGNIDLQINCKEPLNNIKADPHQIEQILMNLVVNAKDALPDGGTILIETGEIDEEQNIIKEYNEIIKKPYVFFSVSDNGVGMTKEVKEKLFEPFFTTKETGKGTGLGLATVYGIVKQHNGYIYVDSEQGKGTTFTVYFPIVEETVVEDNTPKLPETIKGGEETILIVDDDPEILKILRSTLQPIGYTLFEAESGDEAIHIIKNQNNAVDLVLSDIEMPGISALELKKALTSLKPEVKLVFMTGSTNDSVAYQNIIQSESFLLHKPILPSELTVLLRDALDH